MNHIKFLTAVLLGTCVYTALSLLAGRNGVLVYHQLEEQKREISRQTAAIQKINDELSLEYTALEKDGDVIAAYARKLDYVRPGEKLVKINGLRPSQTTLYDTGTALKRHSMKYMTETACKAAGLAVFALLLLFWYFRGFSRRSRKNLMKGIPVYDVPQI